MGITIKPMGGLGNQIFQYAVGRKAAVFHGVPLYADLRHFSESSLRDYQLHTFSSLAQPRTIGIWEDLSNKVVSITDATRTDSAHTREPLFFGLARERKQRFNKRFLALPRQTTLRGYFQSWRYLVGQEDDLANELRMLSKPTPWFRSQTGILKDLGPFVAVHIRLGDYLLDPNFGHLTDYYFHAGFERLGIDSPQVVVFSDEPSRAAGLPFITSLGKKNVLFIESPESSTPVESLNLMALAQHMIISNSTFGWWGAWLAQRNHGGSVIVPTPWLASTESHDNDLIPSTWLRLPARPSAPRLG